MRHLITEAGGVYILSHLMHSGLSDESTMVICALAIANMAQVRGSGHRPNSQFRLRESRGSQNTLLSLEEAPCALRTEQQDAAVGDLQGGRLTLYVRTLGR